MAFVGNPLNFPQLAVKGSPTGSDIVMIADAAAGNALKQATVSSLVAGASAGALVYLGIGTAAASAAINFDNYLTATYDNYLVTIEDLVAATSAATLRMEVGTGAGPTYSTSTYIGAGFDWTSSGGAGRTTATANHQLQSGTNTPSNNANAAGMGNVWVYGANTAHNKSVASQITNLYSGSNLAVGNMYAGIWQTTTVLTSLRFFMSSGNITTGIFRLYGIKNS